MPIDKLQAFYHKYYQPDNAVLTVAGKVDEGKLAGMVNDYFGAIPRPARTLTPTYTVEPVQDGERMTVLRRVGEVQFAVAAYHIPDGGNPDIVPSMCSLTCSANNLPAASIKRWSITKRRRRFSARCVRSMNRAWSCLE